MARVIGADFWPPLKRRFSGLGGVQRTGAGATSAPRPPSSGYGIGYVAGLDGLRALAVAAVLIYHARPGWLQGGFLGVEVFFVISGFLVTSLLAAEWSKDGSINLRRFWSRRGRRLVPAAFVAILAVVLYAALFLPGELASLRGAAAASLAFVANWHLVFANISYFEAFGRPSLLRHFWSLGVEWQFYVLWPLVAWLVLRHLGRTGLAGVALGGALASTLLMALLYSPEIDPSRIYYGTDTRLGGLLLGAALALLWTPGTGAATSRLRAGLLDGAGLLGLAFLAWAANAMHELDRGLYQGGFALVSLATVLLIAVAVHPAARIFPAAMSLAPLRWIGLRSYSIYLWHWPVLMLTRPNVDVSFDGTPLLVLQVALTLALSEVSYRYVEQPFRRGAPLRRLRSTLASPPAFASSQGVFSIAVVAALVGGAATLSVMVASAEPPGRPDFLPSDSISGVIVAGDSPAPDGATEPTEVTPTATPTRTPTATATATLTPTATPASGNAGTTDGSLPLIEIPVPVTATPTPTASPVPTATPTQAPATPPPAATPAAPPEPTPPPAPAAVCALGDSVLLGAAPALANALGSVSVDAAVSRQVKAGIEVLRAWEAGGTLCPTVVIHIGNNGTFTGGQFDELMAAAGDRQVIFVTLRVPRQWEGSNNDVIRAGVERHANAALADWHAASEGHAEYFYQDGTHLNSAGAPVYASLIAQ